MVKKAMSITVIIGVKIIRRGIFFSLNKVAPILSLQGYYPSQVSFEWVIISNYI